MDEILEKIRIVLFRHLDVQLMVNVMNEIRDEFNKTENISHPIEAEIGMPSELLPCPFCGGEASVGTVRISNEKAAKLNNRDAGFFVNCKICGANNNTLYLGYATEDIAKHYWNKRASQ